MLNVQPAWAQVNSAEPASCQGDEASPASGTQPSGLSHWAVKRTLIVSLEPSPASCARAPSCPALQMFTFAHEDVSCSVPGCSVPGCSMVACSVPAARAGTAVTARSAALSATNLDLRGIGGSLARSLAPRRVARLPDQAHGLGRPHGIPALDARRA